MSVTQQRNGELAVPSTKLAQSDSGLLPETFGQVIEMAQLMAKSGPAIPKSFRENPGMCSALCFQAMHWNMNPFSLASSAYVVNDKVAYEAKAIVAAINTSGLISGRLNYEFTGEGQDLRCTVSGRVVGSDQVLTYSSPPKSQISPQNSPLWKTDPEQQMAYRCALFWARRHVPEALLGVMSRDEVSADIRPPEREPSKLDTFKAALKTEDIPADEIKDTPVESEPAEVEADIIDPDTGEVEEAAPAPVQETKQEQAPATKSKPESAKNEIQDRDPTKAEQALTDEMCAGFGAFPTVGSMKEHLADALKKVPVKSCHKQLNTAFENAQADLLTSSMAD